MLPSYKMPIKRNRNIGTKKSGLRKQSKFNIPWQNNKPFYENMKNPRQYQRVIKGKTYYFIVEELNQNYIYTCSIDEISNVLSFVPADDLEGLNLIILRQPKEKEEILDPCWGRLQYDFEFKGVPQPAIILEAINLNRDIKMKKAGISPFFQRELSRLQIEENEITYDKRTLTIKKTRESAKNTQLYRTLLHEIGHYVYFIKGKNIDNYEEKEAFANNYAESIKR